MEDLELGKTSLVKHSIKLTNEIPFKERYQRIPLHQNEEVKKHLKEMREIKRPYRNSTVNGPVLWYWLERRTVPSDFV